MNPTIQDGKEKILSENEVKELLEKVYCGEGNFQQREFTCYGGSSRPDFVILGDNYFKYFEIKTEKDNFLRLGGQTSNAVGLFTHMYMVVPRNKIVKLRDMNWNEGIISIEDLQDGKKEPFQEPKYPWRPSIAKISSVLWADELRSYIKKAKPDMFVIDHWNGGKMTIPRMRVDELVKVFTLFYSDQDSLKILNEVLPNRNYNLRESRGSL